MKRISYCVPCYNEEKNIQEVYNQLTELKNKLPNYDYEIIFEDNNSTDNTQNIIRKLCEKDIRVKAIFNTRNFGPSRSGKNCCFNATGDVIISVASDLQNPIDVIPEFIKYWEDGYKIVMGQKNKSEENRLKFFLRCLYYKIINNNSDIKQIENITGFGAIDAKVYRQIYEMSEPDMSIRHLLAELGYEIKLVQYTQRSRKYGKSSYNLSRNWDFAINSLVTTSKKPIRYILNFGLYMTLLFFLLFVALLILACVTSKPIYLYALLANVVLIFVSFGIFCVGFIGEYIRVIVDKITKREIVIEKERINFSDEPVLKNRKFE